MGGIYFQVLLATLVAVTGAQVNSLDNGNSTRCLQHLAQPRGRLLGAFIPKCDELGHYEPVQRRGSTLYCSSKEGLHLSFVSHVSESSEKNCRCVLDQHELEKAGSQRKLFCDRLGNYDRVQCSNSTCYCSDPYGVKLNETERPIDDFYSMHCGCATDAYAFKRTRRMGLRFNCNEKGNYDNIQCRGSVCYCVDHFGMAINGTSRHIAEYSLITCPVRTALPAVQPCKARLLRSLRKPSPGVVHFSCDDDGYFDPVQMRGSMLLCFSADGHYLGYPTSVGDPKASIKNCLCASDMYENDRIRYVAVSPRCDKLGNYLVRQCNGSDCYCVDFEGNRTADTDC